MLARIILSYCIMKAKLVRNVLFHWSAGSICFIITYCILLVFSFDCFSPEVQILTTKNNKKTAVMLTVFYYRSKRLFFRERLLHREILS